MKQNDSIIKGFDSAGIIEGIKFANDIFPRVGNLFDEHGQHPLQLLLFLLIVLQRNLDTVKV